MSFSWKIVEGQDWSNRARYNIYDHMRKNNISARSLTVEGASNKKLYMFMSGKQDITVTKLMKVANALGMTFAHIFDPIPKHPTEYKGAYVKTSEYWDA